MEEYMKSLKIKMILIISAIVTVVSFLIIGVWATTKTFTISINGNVSFEISDNTLYVKDIRIRDADDVLGQGTTIEDFVPGFVNNGVNVDLGVVEANTSITMLFDVINTTTTAYTASTSATIPNASISASGIIRGEGVDPSTINDDTAISGTIVLNITISDPTAVDLSNMTIEINEYEAPPEESSEVLEFEFQDNVVTSYTGDDSEMIIPSSYSIRESDGAFVEGDAYQVTGIGEFAFSNKKVNSITIPASITSIGKYAFANCRNLTEVNYNATAAANVSYNSGVFYSAGVDSTGITVNLGEGVTSLPAYLFSYSTTSISIPQNVVNVTEVNFSSTINTIGNYAFASCKNLGILNLDSCSNLTNIGNYAFYGCAALNNINLSSCTSLSTIGKYAFESCDNLVNVGIVCPSLQIIDDRAFYSCENLTSLDLSSCPSLATIGSSAFSGCAGLQNLVIPENLTVLEASAFYGCSKLSNITFNAYSLEDLASDNRVFANAGNEAGGISVVFGEGVTKVPNYLFYSTYRNTGYIANVTSVVLPTSLESVGNYAFRETSLSAINLDDCDKLANIGNYAFYSCKGIAQLNLAGNTSLTSIGTSAFYSCSAIKNVDLGNCTSLTTLGNGVFNGASGLTSINLNGCTSLVTIGSSAFSGCTALTSVSIPANVETLGSYAFNACSSLTNANLGSCSKLSEIDDRTFYKCASLKAIAMPANITSIGGSAFYECSSLESVDIPSGVTSIGNSAFNNCTKLTTINFNAKVVNDFSEASSVFANAGNEGTGITINFGEGVTKVPAYMCYSRTYSATYTTNVKTINMSSTIESIGNNAFRNNGNLTSIDLNGCTSLNNIGTYAFYSCAKLSGLDLGDCSGLNNIETYAFYGCTSLETLTLPENISSLGTLSFYNCTMLNEINYNIISLDDFKLDNRIFANAGKDGSGISLNFGASVQNIPAYLFYSAYSGTTFISNITSIQMSPSIEKIGNYVFYKCENLASANFNNCRNLVSVGSYAFGSCSNLVADIDLSNCSNLTSIGSFAFYDCTKLRSLNLDNCNKLTTIGSYSFQNCSAITSITIPANVTTINDGAFRNCTALTTLNYNAIAVPDFEYQNGVFEKAGQNASGITVNFGSGVKNIPAEIFSPTPSDTSLNANIKVVNFTSSIESIGQYAFFKCTGISSLSLSSCTNLKTIGLSAFEGCVVVGTIRSTKMESIGQSAFVGCTRITSVNLSGATNLKSIGYGAFSGCTGLTSFNIDNCTNLTSIGERAFSGCTKLTSFDVSDCTKLNYIGARVFYNCTAIRSINFGSNTDGWYRRDTSTGTGGYKVDFSNATNNVTLFTRTYVEKYFKRNI